MHNSLRNLLSQRWMCSINDYHSSLFIITKHNGITKLQHFLKRNSFANKSTKQPIVKCLVILSNLEVQKL
jgi:uncharacterized Ntn-hydrolase superfamily protein